jgi:hypothetical protein
VRVRFEGGWAKLLLTDKNWHTQLPTLAERQAFNELYPDQALDEWGFVTQESDNQPASSEYKTRDIFKRSRDFYQGRFPRLPFDPPDLAGVPFSDKYRVEAVARGRWFQENGLKITAKERAWIKDGPAPSPHRETVAQITRANARGLDIAGQCSIPPDPARPGAKGALQ